LRKITCLLPLSHQVMYKLDCYADPVPLLPIRWVQCRSGTECCRVTATPEQDFKTFLVLWRPGTELGQTCCTVAKHDTQVTAHFEGSGHSRYVSGCLNIMFLVYRYFLKFHAVKAYHQGYMCLDDFSMSPECFGFGKLRIAIICSTK
jgi:hypothetical protein